MEDPKKPWAATVADPAPLNVPEDPELDEEIDDREDPDDVIDSWLSDIEPGNLLVIKRLEPTWARGWLEEIPIEDNQRPIDLERIRNRWGGHKLSLRVRRPGGTLGKAHRIDLYSFEPMRYGRPILWNAEKNPHLGPDANDPTPSPPVQMQNPAPNTDIIAQILQSQQAMLIQAMQKPQEAPAQQKSVDFAQLGEALSLVKTIQGMSAPAAIPAAIGGDMEGLTALVPMISALLGKQDRPKLTGPAQKLPPPTPQKTNPAQNVAQQIASLGPDGAAKACAEILANIPDDQREQAVESFFTHAKIPLGDEDFEDDEPENNED